MVLKCIIYMTKIFRIHHHGCGSADPDPDPDPNQNDMDPKHCIKVLFYVNNPQLHDF